MEVIGTGGKDFIKCNSHVRLTPTTRRQSPRRERRSRNRRSIIMRGVIQNEMVFGRGPKLVLAGFTWMPPLAVAGMASNPRLGIAPYFHRRWGQEP